MYVMHGVFTYSFNVFLVYSVTRWYYVWDQLLFSIKAMSSNFHSNGHWVGQISPIIYIIITLFSVQQLSTFIQFSWALSKGSSPFTEWALSKGSAPLTERALSKGSAPFTDWTLSKDRLQFSGQSIPQLMYWLLLGIMGFVFQLMQRWNRFILILHIFIIFFTIKIWRLNMIANETTITQIQITYEYQ